MIALYKMSDSLENQIGKLFQGAGYKTARFSSVNALLEQIMNPMVIITPAIHQKELEALQVPILPLSIRLDDIERTKEKKGLMNDSSNKCCVVASEEEIEWLKKEFDENPRIPLHFLSKEELFLAGMQPDTVYVAPVWMKDLLTHSQTGTVHFIKPSLSSLISTIQMAISIDKLTASIAMERYQVEAIVKSAHDGVVAVDHEGRITVANEHAKKLLGLQDGVKGHKITEFIPHSDLMRILATGKIEMGDIATVMGRQIVINRFPVIVKGKIVGVVSSFKEINNIQKMELKLRKMLHQSGLEAKHRLSDIVGRSSELVKAKDLAQRFAQTDATVLITGESGTGKELFAQGIHLASPRVLGPFVAVNCSALPESLLESELFGYEEGAFTGANKGGKAGLFELAHGGTLFLDEIGEMPLHIQALLLRVLQERTVRRVGGERVVPVDVRIIAATNRKLEEEIREKKFRTDLYYRINVLNVELPPLRDRLIDIPDLLEAIVNQFNEKRETKIVSIDNEVYTLFKAYDWPGNIRELRNIVERMVLLEEGTTLTVQSGEFLLQKLNRNKSQKDLSDLSIKVNERELIEAALKKYFNNKTKTAQALGVDRSTLWRKLKEYNL
ncbi:sigma 54-interacting transcriptional regulator [Peribacillus simplex]|uniref:sigma 54-interacting transcriptional regulator n=1 Tax=Peribacillus simplex TaxID=1478 RepID=UPI0024C1B7E8|nr:sigma 54-interacting transcriptional regulator [Peribacillus simplex]WHY99992.1 sigma 54-interacting transcriptional regulator [Peribacillus simplex]